MPHFENRYYRLWCKTCNEYELHSRKVLKEEDRTKEREVEYVCENCSTVYTDVFYKDIPEEKLEEQRKRWRAKKRNDFIEMFEILQPGYHERKFMRDMFSAPGSNTETIIIEADAGQKHIDAVNKKNRDAEIQKRINEREALKKEYEPYRKLGRNDKCLCGSGKKYKQCCLPKFQSIA